MPRSSSYPPMSALSSIVSSLRTDWFGGALRDCDSVRARLHEYVDDELDRHVPSERAIRLAVANHVAHCVHCARVEAQLRAMHLAVAAVGARMRGVERPRLASPQSPWASDHPVLTLLSFDRLPDTSRNASRDGARDRAPDSARTRARESSRRIRPRRHD